MGLELQLRAIDMNGPTGEASSLSMSRKPTDDELFELLTRNARVSLEEVKRHPHGAVFPSAVVVSAKEAGWEHRLDLGNAQMLHDLRALGDVETGDRVTWATDDFPLRLVSRRMHTRYNSGGHGVGPLQEADPTNPAFIHPIDLDARQIEDGDIVEVASARAAIRAVARADDTLRPGLVSMAHAWGDAPDRDHEVRSRGGPTSRLSDVDDAFDPYSGQPVMSNIPVEVRRLTPLYR
jgi:anaerobic selenocysteine-containing dehydrogenase